MPSGSQTSAVHGLPSSQTVPGFCGSQKTRPPVNVVPKPPQFQLPEALSPSAEALPCITKVTGHELPEPLTEKLVPLMVPVRFGTHGATPPLKESEVPDWTRFQLHTVLSPKSPTRTNRQLPVRSTALAGPAPSRRIATPGRPAQEVRFSPMASNYAAHATYVKEKLGERLARQVSTARHCSLTGRSSAA